MSDTRAEIIEMQRKWDEEEEKEKKDRLRATIRKELGGE